MSTGEIDYTTIIMAIVVGCMISCCSTCVTSCTPESFQSVVGLSTSSFQSIVLIAVIYVIYTAVSGSK